MWNVENSIYDEPAIPLGETSSNLSAQQSALHPYLREQDSKQENGRKHDTIVHGTNILTPIPVSEHTHPTMWEGQKHENT